MLAFSGRIRKWAKEWFAEVHHNVTWRSVIAYGLPVLKDEVKALLGSGSGSTQLYCRTSANPHDTPIDSAATSSSV